MRTVLVTPIGPGEPRNGLAHRAAQWHRALAEVSESVTVVVPVSGPATAADGWVVAPDPDDRIDVPRLARGCTADLGRRVGAGLGRADVVVGFRSYLGDVASGIAEAVGAALLVDLDDDDAEYLRRSGDPVEAERYERLVAELTARADLVVSARPGRVGGCVPNAVDLPPQPERRPSKRVLLVGNHRYAPNADGARWMAEEVFPLVAAAVPEATLELVGPGSEHLGGRGVVDDLGPVYASAGVAVVPIRTGSGTRVKAVEAWAHEVPVVATTLGIEGLGATDGLDVVLADDAAGFAAAVVGLLTDPGRAAAIGRAGRARVAAAFDAASVRRDMAGLVRSLVGTATWHVVSAGGLELTPVDDGLVVAVPATGAVHHLNGTAAAVYALADGTLTAAGIAEAFAEELGLEEPPLEPVADAVAQLVRAGIVRHRRSGV